MQLLIAWLFFPILLALTCAGWGLLVVRLSGLRVPGALIVPLGAASALVVAALFTAYSASAPAAVPVVGAIALASLLWLGPRELPRLRSSGGWPLLAAVGVLLVYGAPVIFSGKATFAGYIRLDDTADWFGMTDQLFRHGRDFSDLPLSTYTLVLAENLTNIGYPSGSFMLLGIGRGLVGADVAWVFQPYLAFCGVLVALASYALLDRILVSVRLRALVAFLAAQSALLYGYSLWGGVKETTMAFLVTTIAAVAAATVWDGSAPHAARTVGAVLLAGARRALPLAIVAAAIPVTIGPGGVVWAGPPLVVVGVVWVWRAWISTARRPALIGALVASAALAGLTAALALPMWNVFSAASGDINGLTASASTPGGHLLLFGNLIQPLSGWQLAGIWPTGDFRLHPSTAPTVALIAIVVLAALGALVVTLLRGQRALFGYLALALLSTALVRARGGTPWVIGKALAIDSPALLLTGLVGAALLWQALAPRRLRAGVLAWAGGLAPVIVLGAIAFGVLWSNYLAYHDVLLAPRDRLAELQHIGPLVAGKGPALINEYDIYGDRHFLRDAAPEEPAEYRPHLISLHNGALLTKTGYADIDSFPLSSLSPYRSIVTQASPVESRPPSIYRLVWAGRYYDLWQRPAAPSRRILEHIPFGDSNTLPYCGTASPPAPGLPLCADTPTATPACTYYDPFARRAAQQHAHLVAYTRPTPVVARGTQTLWPGAWGADTNAQELYPNSPGTATAHIQLAVPQRYGFWLGGSFSRGFDARVDGRKLGHVYDQLTNLAQWVHVADLRLGTGVHTITLTYPKPSFWQPGSGDNEFTNLWAIAFEPLDTPGARLLSLAPSQARQLCGRPLDWLEIVSGAA